MVLLGWRKASFVREAPYEPDINLALNNLALVTKEAPVSTCVYVGWDWMMI